MLRATVDELCAAQEELRSQNEALSESRDFIEEERHRYETLFEFAPDAYLTTDEVGKIEEANRSAVRLLRREHRFLLGKPLLACVAPPSRRALRNELQRIRDGDEPRELDVEVWTRDRSPVTARARLGAVRDRDGRIRAVRWTLHDVTEQRQAETELRLLAAELDRRVTERTLELETATRALDAERMRLARLLERLPEGIVAVGLDGRVEYANPAAASMLGDDVASVGTALPERWNGVEVARRVDELITGDAVLELLAEAHDRGETYHLLGVPAGASGAALLVVTDVSARVRVERARREFVMNAAHELRTPLAAIAAAVEVLQGGAKESREERDHFLAHVERESARLSRLVQALLVLARAQSGEEVPRVEIVPLAPLLERLAEAARPAPDVELTIDCAPELAAIANADLAEQALSALVQNAVRHTSRGWVALRACPDGERVLVEVADSGVGIPPEVQDRVFERFFRTSSDGDRFGLGLAIARQAVDALGGEIALESEPGVGTTVRVLLPGARLR